MGKCQQCGAVVLNEDLWVVKKGSGKVLMCGVCLVETNPSHARAYYYNSPYCVKCGEKIRGYHRHVQPG